MKAETEKRLLQACVALACFVPLSAGSWGVIEGAGALRGLQSPVPVDLDSHYRYLSGLLLGIGIGFVACIPNIERKGLLFRALGLIVLVGGLSRLLSLVEAGTPGPGHQFGLVMELVTVPLLALWQLRVERRFTS
ncbi:MAG TPA: DUF4345 domain-containing protein [Allosphingosinicella sp.]|jgi:hypothetical protein